MKKTGAKVKKNIKMFLNSEEGKMLDADIVKTGLALGILGAVTADQADAQIGWSIQTHTNRFTDNAHLSVLGHTSHASHGSHGSHGSHARGGWC